MYFHSSSTGVSIESNFENVYTGLLHLRTLAFIPNNVLFSLQIDLFFVFIVLQQVLTDPEVASQEGCIKKVGKDLIFSKLCSLLGFVSILTVFHFHLNTNV